MAFTSEQLTTMDSIVARYPRKRSAIMPLLHFVQSIEGYVTSEGIEVISQKIDVETAEVDRKSTRLNSSHIPLSRMPSSA